MRLATILFAGAAVILSVGCSSSDKVLVHDSSVLNTSVVCLEPQDSIDLCLSSPRRFWKKGDHIYIIDTQNSGGMLVDYSLKDGSGRSFISKGRGPGEMIGLFDAAFPTGNTIALLDITLGKIAVLPVDSLNCGSLTLETITRSEVASIDGCCRICGTDSILYSAGDFKDCRIKSLSLGGDVEDVVSYSPDTKRRAPTVVSNQAFDGFMDFNEKHSSIVRACMNADQIEIIEVSTEKVTIIKGPDKYEPVYTIVKSQYGDAVCMSGDSHFCYPCVQAFDDVIVALYDGRRRDQARSGRFLRFFNWEGDVVFQYDLGRHVDWIDYDPHSREIYALASPSNLLIYRLGAE